MKAIRYFLFVVVACECMACSHVRPWERGKLAHQSMTSDQASVAAEHVYAVHEGATGGGASAESGCGCN